MKKNIGTTDRIIRLFAAIAIAIFYFAGMISGTLAIVLIAIAVILIATSFISFCPIYFPFGFSTRKNKSPNQ